jgi:glyoxylate/hydroxypyruvate reductase A
MALLIVNLDKQIGNAQAWRDNFAAQLPDLEIRFWPDTGNVADIKYLAFIRPDFDALPELPNLKAMFSRSAGVEAFVNHPRLPKAPLGKVEPSGGDPMMTEYVVMHVLRFHRDMPAYQAAQANREWLRTRIVRPEERRVGFLGLGLGAFTAAECRDPNLSRRAPARAVFVPDRHRGLSLAADPGDRGHLLCPHLCDDAEGVDADQCGARQACSA